MIDSNTLIIIPVFNCADNIHKSLDSCLIQSIRSQILVLDNCSTDNTQPIVQSYSKVNDNIKLIINERNLGRIGNFNASLDYFMESKYKYLKILFSGDELVVDSIKIPEGIFTKHEGLSMVNGLYTFNYGKTKREVAKYFPEDRRVGVKELVEIGVYPSSATGTLNSVTYSKQGIGDLRSNPLFLGIGMFHNDILLNNGDIYYTNNVLGIFNLEVHKSFHKQYDYLYIYEYAFTKLYGLENSEKFFSKSEYDKVRLSIALQVIMECFSIGKTKLLIKVMHHLLVKLYFKIISKFNFKKK